MVDFPICTAMFFNESEFPKLYALSICAKPLNWFCPSDRTVSILSTIPPKFAASREEKQGMLATRMFPGGPVFVANAGIATNNAAITKIR